MNVLQISSGVAMKFSLESSCTFGVFSLESSCKFGVFLQWKVYNDRQGRQGQGRNVLQIRRVVAMKTSRFVRGELQI